MSPSRSPAVAGAIQVAPPEPEPAALATPALTQAERAARALAEGRRATPVPLDRAFLLSALDLRRALRTLAAALVPRFADWCFVDLVGEGGLARRVEVAHGDPAQAPLAAALRDLAFEPGWSTPSIQAMRDRAPRLLAELSPELLAWATQGEGHAQLLRDIRANSLLAVPLVAGERVIGAVTVIRSGSAPALGADDLRFLEAVAVPAAIALDSAARHAEALETAERERAARVAVERAFLSQKA